mgnify:CR=1 FL=1
MVRGAYEGKTYNRMMATKELSTCKANACQALPTLIVSYSDVDANRHILQ